MCACVHACVRVCVRACVLACVRVRACVSFSLVQDVQFKGPVNAVSGHKITPNRFKTTYRSVLMFEEKKQSVAHLFKTFSGLD